MNDWVRLPLTSEEGNPLFIDSRDGSLAEERDGAYLVAYRGPLYRVPIGDHLQGVARDYLNLPDVGMLGPCSGHPSGLPMFPRKTVCPACYTTHPDKLDVYMGEHADTCHTSRYCPTCKREVEGEWRLRR